MVKLKDQCDAIKTAIAMMEQDVSEDVAAWIEERFSIE